MKNIYIILFFTLLISNLFAQSVSINDNGTAADANAILDIDISTNDKGVLIPRLTTAQITAMGVVTTGMMVFNETVGDFQFYNGTSWLTVGAVGNNSIYAGSGSLSGNTVVTQGASTLDFLTSVTDGFSVDGTTFSVDGSNNRVGIGTAAPAQMLDVAGNGKFNTGAGTHIYVGPSASVFSDATNLVANMPAGGNFYMAPYGITGTKVVASNGNLVVGGAGQTSANALVYGNIGIGNAETAPGSQLDINNTTVPRMRFRVNGEANGFTIGTNGPASEAFLWMEDAERMVFGTSSTYRMMIAADGKVGIGANAPTRELNINGGGQTDLQAISGIYSNPNSTNAQITSETSGGIEGGIMTHSNGNVYVGAWSANNLVFRAANTDYMTIATNGDVSVDGTTFNIDASTDRVGIGTAAPGSNFHIAGTGNVLQTIETTSGTTNEAQIDLISGAGKMRMFYRVSDQTFGLYNGAATKFRINGASNVMALMEGGGNVGIGTATPGRLLELASSSAPGLKINDSNASGNAFVELATVDGTTSYFQNTGGRTRIFVNATESMTFLTTGNVGVNNATPSAQLDVVGTTELNGAVTAIGDVTLSDGAAAGNIAFVEPGGANKAIIQSQAMGADYTLTLPVDDGAADEVLTTDGSGNLSWGKGPAVYYATGAVNPISSTTNVTVTSQSFTTTAASSTVVYDYHVIFKGLNTGSSGVVASASLELNGATVKSSTWNQSLGSQWETVPVTVRYVATIAAGTHTVSGTGAMSTAGRATMSSDATLIITVYE